MHVHKNAHKHITLDSGGHYEVCECGATRKICGDGTVDLGTTGGRFNAKNDKEGWHTCELCTH